jgi:hypothetical protein
MVKNDEGRSNETCLVIMLKKEILAGRNRQVSHLCKELPGLLEESSHYRSLAEHTNGFHLNILCIKTELGR